LFRIKPSREENPLPPNSPHLFDVIGYHTDFLDPQYSGRKFVDGESLLPSPPTTCVSPLSSGSGLEGVNAAGSTLADRNGNYSTGGIEPSYFSPYSTALSVTIAIGKVSSSCFDLQYLFILFIYTTTSNYKSNDRAILLKKSY